MNSAFEITMKDLWDVAMKDGVITPEEKDILDQVRIDADSYSTMLQECRSAGMIKKRDLEKLENLKYQIIKRASLIAKIDDDFDEDEIALISKLVELIDIHHKLDLNLSNGPNNRI